MNDVIGPSSFQFPSDSTMVPEEPEESCVNDIFAYCNNLAFVKKLSDAKFPVYLVSYIPTNQHYAMKIFPWEDDAPSTFYLNEVRFGQFNHPNIVSMVYYVDEQDCSTNGVPSKVSYILMDYARYGDFFDVLITDKIPFNDMLIRTYFHQVIASLEALHSQGAAHLDVKLENLLLTEDFTLKLTDFDLSYMTGDGKVKIRGTKNFRAPEMLNGRCMNPQAADIYSAGIILFLMKTCGRVPYKEDSHHKGIDFEELKQNNPKEFWKKQCETLGKKATFFDEDFKTLFMWMTRNQAEKRPSIEEIKSSRWYKKEVYSEEELLVYMTGQYLGK